jgi:hypothetical protein
MRKSKFQILVVLSVVFALLLIAGCKKSEPVTTAAPAAAAAPAATTPAPAQPAPAPEPPTPSFSAAQNIGMFVYPKNNQDHNQQLRDEYDCYTVVEEQTGIDPSAPAPTGPSSAQVQAAEQQAAANASQAQGGRARGAARGAAGGAMIGAIAGDAGKGAAIGAVGGTMRGGRRQRETNAASKEQAAQSAGAQMQQQANQAKAAYNKKLDTFKRGFSACMDARAYSVK